MSNGSTPYSVSQIIEYAISKERVARALYADAAKEAKSPSARKLLSELAEAEAKHEKSLKNMDLSRLRDVTPDKVQDLRIAEFLEDVELSPDADFQSILIYAMKREERSRDFYAALADATEDPEIKKLFNALATEEAAHKKRIETLYDEEVLSEN